MLAPPPITADKGNGCTYQIHHTCHTVQLHVPFYKHWLDGLLKMLWHCIPFNFQFGLMGLSLDTMTHNNIALRRKIYQEKGVLPILPS